MAISFWNVLKNGSSFSKEWQLLNNGLKTLFPNGHDYGLEGLLKEIKEIHLYKVMYNNRERKEANMAIIMSVLNLGVRNDMARSLMIANLLLPW